MRWMGVNDRVVSKSALSRIANRLEMHAEKCAQNSETRSVLTSGCWPWSVAEETAIRKGGGGRKHVMRTMEEGEGRV